MIQLTVAEYQLLELLADWVEKGKPNLIGLGKTSAMLLSCPAASNSHGEKVFAVFNENTSQMKYLSATTDVPEILKETLDMNEFALKNRLAGKCFTASCQHWQGACRLGYFVSKVSVSPRVTSRHCAIEDTCRWRKENGEKTCTTCAFVRNLPVHTTSINQAADVEISVELWKEIYE